MRSLRCRRDSSIFYLCVETATLQLRMGAPRGTIEEVRIQRRAPSRSLLPTGWRKKMAGHFVDATLILSQTSGLTAHMLDLLFR